MLGLLERNTGKPASEWLELKDADALGLELAITQRLLRFDNDVMEANAVLTANKIGVMLFGEKE